MAKHPTDRTFPKKDIWDILQDTMKGYTTAADNIKSGFRCTEICPLSEDALINRTFFSIIFIGMGIYMFMERSNVGNGGYGTVVYTCVFLVKEKFFLYFIFA